MCFILGYRMLACKLEHKVLQEKAAEGGPGLSGTWLLHQEEPLERKDFVSVLSFPSRWLEHNVLYMCSHT